MKNRVKVCYILFIIGIFSLTTVGATYAYWANNARGNDVMSATSNKYSISMNINPIYNDFSFIPMNNSDVLKAISNECRDKYDRGACSLYYIDIYGYNDEIGTISGTIKFFTDIKNLNYAILKTKIDDGECVSISIDDNDDEFCLYDDYTKVSSYVEQVLFDSYSVSDADKVRFILVIWLENQDRSQNDYDIGSFSANVTISSLDGIRVQGVINSAVEVNNP